MWNIDRPTTTAGDAFETSISRIADLALKTRLAGITANIVDAETQYTAAANNGELHTFPAAETIGPVTKAELVGIYDYRMAKKGAPGRAIYDALLVVPEHGRCPFCGQRRVATLDHHLPKSSYPVLAVTPVNLVPACRDCNSEKLSIAPAGADQVFLHPYFDRVDDERWLVASVVNSSPPTVSFSIDPTALPNALVRARVKYHFDQLKLATLYSAHAAEELAGIRGQLRCLFKGGGTAAVKLHLADNANSHETARRNSWQTAMYRAIEVSESYCGGGFDF
jgi:hypothetical protein